MKDEQMRQNFEQSFVEHHGAEDHLFAQRKNGEYVSASVDAAWWAWQAASLLMQPKQEHINYSEWNYNPMTGEKIWAQPPLPVQQWKPEDHYADGWRDALHSIKQTLPLPVQRQPLTLDEIAKLIDNCKANVQNEFLVELIRAAEAAHNIGAKP